MDEGATVFVGILLVVVLTVGALGCTINHLEAPGSLARIESLRADVQRVDMAESEDVIGQVTQWNQRIREMQAYNARWWAAWMVPNAWDRVALITVPER